jgi:DNA polymerase-3 subunit beta
MALEFTMPVKPLMTGAITVPAKKFADIIKELPDSESISVSVKKNNMVSIDCSNSSFKIMGLPKDEFPQLPEFKNKDAITLSQKKLKTMLNMTSFAISNDEARHVLNGLLFVIKPSFIRLVATDGRHLATCEDKAQFPKTLERKFIVPTNAVNELAKTLADEGEVRIVFAENQILFEASSMKLVSRLIDGEFPDYEQVIPKELKDKVSVDRLKLLSALKRAALFTKADSMAVKIELAKDKMVVSKSAPDIGEARIELEAEYKGKDLAVGFRPEYLVDLLKNIAQEKAVFEMVDAEKPGVLRIGSEYTYVVMPMHID